MKTLLAVVPVVFLAGCATNQLDQQLTGLVGKPVGAAVAQLGAPSSERQVGAVREIEWRNVKTTYGQMPRVGYNGFYLSNTVRFTPVAAFTPDNRTVPSPDTPRPVAPSELKSVPEYCTVTLRVDRKDTVQSFRYDGNYEGCDAYAHALGGKA